MWSVRTSTKSKWAINNLHSKKFWKKWYFYLLVYCALRYTSKVLIRKLKLQCGKYASLGRWLEKFVWLINCEIISYFLMIQVYIGYENNQSKNRINFSHNKRKTSSPGYSHRESRSFNSFKFIDVFFQIDIFEFFYKVNEWFSGCRTLQLFHARLQFLTFHEWCHLFDHFQ